MYPPSNLTDSLPSLQDCTLNLNLLLTTHVHASNHIEWHVDKQKYCALLSSDRVREPPAWAENRRAIVSIAKMNSSWVVICFIYSHRREHSTIQDLNHLANQILLTLQQVSGAGKDPG